MAAGHLPPLVTRLERGCGWSFSYFPIDKFRFVLLKRKLVENINNILILILYQLEDV
jgi:hypothetical protein